MPLCHTCIIPYWFRVIESIADRRSSWRLAAEAMDLPERRPSFSQDACKCCSNLLWRCMVDPRADFIFYWSILMFFAVIENALQVPICVAFEEMATLFPVFLWAHYFSDAVFILDIILNFLTGYSYMKGTKMIVGKFLSKARRRGREGTMKPHFYLLTMSILTS